MKPVLIIHCCPKPDTQRQLEWCLRNFRSHFPAMPAMLISDGLAYWHSVSAKRFGLLHVRGERSKHVRFGGLWIRRMLESGIKLAEESDADVLWKIDPDTWIRRPFETTPPDAAYFGHRHNKEIPHIQGGCAFLRIDAARRMLAALAEPARFADFKEWLPEALPDKIREWLIKTGWLSSDFVTLKLIEELSLTSEDWPEVFSVCNLTRLPTELSEFAVVHPRKV